MVLLAVDFVKREKAALEHKVSKRMTMLNRITIMEGQFMMEIMLIQLYREEDRYGRIERSYLLTD